MNVDHVVLTDVSKFYGEVLGVNRVSLDLPPGLTGLVGPNGAGKSTLMHLVTGLLRPSRGTVSVLGISPERPDELFRVVGYCTQYDTFPVGVTGFAFLRHALRLHGLDRTSADDRAWQAIERVGLTDAAERRIAGYSKGMRQRIKLAHALCHGPRVLVLDEPLNGLDPMARAEVIGLFRELADEGRHVIVSSHILHEVDAISDTIVMVHGGTVVAEGAIRAVRGQITSHPIQVLIRCERPREVAARLVAMEHVAEVRVLGADEGLMVSTRDAEAFFPGVTEVLLETGVAVETVAAADETVHAVYEYLIGGGAGGGS